ARRRGKFSLEQRLRIGRQRRSRGRAARLVGRLSLPPPPRTPGGPRRVGWSCLTLRFLRSEPLEDKGHKPGSRILAADPKPVKADRPHHSWNSLSAIEGR